MSCNVTSLTIARIIISFRAAEPVLNYKNYWTSGQAMISFVNPMISPVKLGHTLRLSSIAYIHVSIIRCRCISVGVQGLDFQCGEASGF